MPGDANNDALKDVVYDRSCSQGVYNDIASLKLGGGPCAVWMIIESRILRSTTCRCR